MPRCMARRASPKPSGHITSAFDSTWTIPIFARSMSNWIKLPELFRAAIEFYFLMSGKNKEGSVASNAPMSQCAPNGRVTPR